MTKDLGYKRFIFTDAQQITLRDLLIRQHRVVATGCGPLDASMARKYKGLITSMRRQASKQKEYVVQLSKDSVNPRPEDVGYAPS